MESSQWTKSIFPGFFFSFRSLIYGFLLSFVVVREFSNASKILLRDGNENVNVKISKTTT